MKKILLSLIAIFIFAVPAFASLKSPLKYNNIKLKSKITYNAELDSWSDKVSKTTEEFYTKLYDLNIGKNIYVDKSGEQAFETDCDYEFIYNGKFVCYSNSDLMFYQLSYTDGQLNKTKMPEEDIMQIIPEYNIVKISDFSELTNSIKIKKHHSELYIFIMNDTDKKFDDYCFSSGNSKIRQYSLNGFAKISKAGMIQFAKNNDETKSCPWYILLIR